MTDQFTRDQRLAASANQPLSRWLPATLLLAGALTIAAVGYVYLRDPASPAAIAIRDMVFPGQANIPAADETTAPAGAGDASQADEPELSEWEEQREDELAVQRRLAEMPANTPGVTPEQYVGEGDDSSFMKEGEEDQEEE